MIDGSSESCDPDVSITQNGSCDPDIKDPGLGFIWECRRKGEDPDGSNMIHVPVGG